MGCGGSKPQPVAAAPAASNDVARTPNTVGGDANDTTLDTDVEDTMGGDGKGKGKVSIPGCVCVECDSSWARM